MKNSLPFANHPLGNVARGIYRRKTMEVKQASREETLLTPQQVSDFHLHGFLSVEQISPPEEIARLRVIFQRLFEEGAGRNEGASFDLVTPDEDENTPPALPQIINPVSYAPELRTTLFRKNALAMARQLLGPKATGTFEHAILKPANYGATTPWHQDEAFRGDDTFFYDQVSFWMPLQPATLDNGCMQYIAGSNKGEILPHQSPDNNPKVHSIECAEGFDPADAVACPLPGGGAVMHSGRTLHTAGPNRSDIPRYAYVLAFETPPRPAGASRNFYWNKNKQSADIERRRAWRKKGGVLIEIARKFQGGTWKNPDRMMFELRRVARAVLAKKR